MQLAQFETHLTQFETHLTQLVTRLTQFVTRLTQFATRLTQFATQLTRLTQFATRLTHFGDSETSSDVDLEDNEIYQKWYERSMQVSEPARTDKYEKYVGEGMAEQRAREKAFERTLWATKSNFFNTYEEFLEATVQLEDDGTHQEIIADIEEKMRRGLDSRKAVKRVLPKHKHQFESLFEYKSDDEDDSGTDADSLEDGLDH